MFWKLVSIPEQELSEGAEGDGVEEQPAVFLSLCREYAPTDGREWPHYFVEVRLYEQEMGSFNDERMVVLVTCQESESASDELMQFHPASLSGAILSTVVAAQAAFDLTCAELGVERVEGASFKAGSVKEDLRHLAKNADFTPRVRRGT